MSKGAHALIGFTFLNKLVTILQKHLYLYNYIQMILFKSNKASPRYHKSQPRPILHLHLTSLYKLLPPLGPFCELLGICLLNLRPLMDTVHYIIAQPVTVIYPLYCTLVVTNLYVTKKQKNVTNTQMQKRQNFF